MNKKNVQALVAGLELDALVAAKVFGLVPCQSKAHHDGIGGYDFPCYALPESPTKGAELHRYSTDIAAAWEVVDHLRSRFTFALYASREGFVVAWDASSRPCFGSTMPEAICLAALKAVGAKATTV